MKYIRTLQQNSRFVLAITLLACVVPSCGSNQPSFHASHFSPFTSQLTPQKDTPLKDSLARLNDSIRLFPRNTDFRLKKAALNIELFQWDYAIEEYGRVLQLDPNNLAALYFRAYAHTHERHYDQARNDYEAFLAIMPRHFEAQLGLAMLKRKMHRSMDAMEDLNKLVQMFPDSAMAYAARAGYEVELKQYDVALFDWEEAIKRNPENVEFLVSKVDVLIELKRYAEAWQLIEEAMKKGVPRAALKPWIDKCK